MEAVCCLERAMRGLFLLLSVWIALGLAVDAYGFDGRHRKAVLREVSYQVDRFVYEVTHVLN